MPPRPNLAQRLNSALSVQPTEEDARVASLLPGSSFANIQSLEAGRPVADDPQPEAVEQPEPIQPEPVAAVDDPELVIAPAPLPRPQFNQEQLDRLTAPKTPMDAPGPPGMTKVQREAQKQRLPVDAKPFDKGRIMLQAGAAMLMASADPAMRQLAAGLQAGILASDEAARKMKQRTLQAERARLIEDGRTSGNMAESISEAFAMGDTEGAEMMIQIQDAMAADSPEWAIGEELDADGNLRTVWRDKKDPSNVRTFGVKSRDVAFVNNGGFVVPMNRNTGRPLEGAQPIPMTVSPDANLEFRGATAVAQAEMWGRGMAALGQASAQLNSLPQYGRYNSLEDGLVRFDGATAGSAGDQSRITAYVEAVSGRPIEQVTINMRERIMAQLPGAKSRFQNWLSFWNHDGELPAEMTEAMRSEILSQRDAAAAAVIPELQRFQAGTMMFGIPPGYMSAFMSNNAANLMGLPPAPATPDEAAQTGPGTRSAPEDTDYGAYGDLVPQGKGSGPAAVGPTSSVDAIADAIASSESGGHANPYTAKNPKSSAFGKYQMIDSTWKAYAKDAGVDPSRRRDPEAQEKVAKHAMARLLRKYGDPELVAIAWFQGEGVADQAKRKGKNAVAGKKDATGTTTRKYLNDFREAYGE